MFPSFFTVVGMVGHLRHAGARWGSQVLQRFVRPEFAEGVADLNLQEEDKAVQESEPWLASLTVKYLVC